MPSIDERLAALAQSVELLAGMQRESELNLNSLISLVRSHEQEQDRFRRVMRAAFNEFLEGENGNGERP